MVCVRSVAVVLGAMLAPLYVRIFMPRFTSEEAALCTQMTRIMLPQPLFFFVGGVFGSALLVRKVFTFQAVSPLIYNIAIILGGVLLGKSMGVFSGGGCGSWSLPGVPDAEPVGSVPHRGAFSPQLRLGPPRAPRMDSAFPSLHAGRHSGHLRQMDPQLFRVRHPRADLAIDLCQESLHCADGGARASGWRCFAAFLRVTLQPGSPGRLCLRR